MASTLTAPTTPPATPKPFSESWQLDLMSGHVQNDFDLSRTVTTKDTSQWVVNARLPVMSRDEVSNWLGFLSGCRGGNGSFYWGPTLQGGENNLVAQDSGNPVVSEFDLLLFAGFDCLKVSGFDAEAVNDFLLAGDWFEVDGYLYRVTQNADKDASGNVEILFQPPLKTAPDPGASVNFSNPKGRFTLKADMPWVGFNSGGVGGQINLQLLELNTWTGDDYYNGWGWGPDPFIEWDVNDDFESYDAESPVQSILDGGSSNFKTCPDWNTAWSLESDPFIEYAIFDNLEGYTAEAPIVSTLDDEQNVFGTSTGFESAWVFANDPLVEWDALDDLESYSAASPIVASLNGGTGFDGAWNFN